PFTDMIDKTVLKNQHSKKCFTSGPQSKGLPPCKHQSGSMKDFFYAGLSDPQTRKEYGAARLRKGEWDPDLRQTLPHSSLYFSLASDSQTIREWNYTLQYGAKNSFREASTKAQRQIARSAHLQQRSKKALFSQSGKRPFQQFCSA